MCDFTDEKERLERILLQNLRAHLPAMRELLERVNSKAGYEDGLYRFYYQSFKVFRLQDFTAEIVGLLKEITPEGRGFCEFFREILAAGTERKFDFSDNQHWIERTAPIVQAFLHARYFLEMAVTYAAELEEPPQPMPFGWAAILCLYDLR
ncbi:MAG TPA: hypothetical protein VG722_04160 [Tepidisphaeraceae bacterium]|nr:hypothetical protein [Tepidisphaeraceae bacterium]